MKPAFHPSHTPWKSLRGFPHYHGYDGDYHASEDRQSPPETRNQSHSHRKGLVNHVPGLKRKGCPGTLSLLPAARACGERACTEFEGLRQGLVACARHASRLGDAYRGMGARRGPALKERADGW
jgi:hypothetical protein